MKRHLGKGKKLSRSETVRLLGIDATSEPRFREYFNEHNGDHLWESRGGSIIYHRKPLYDWLNSLQEPATEVSSLKPKGAEFLKVNILKKRLKKSHGTLVTGSEAMTLLGLERHRWKGFSKLFQQTIDGKQIVFNFSGTLLFKKNHLIQFKMDVEAGAYDGETDLNRANYLRYLPHR